MSDYEKYLFRGKEKDSGKWIYGDLRHISDGHGGYILCIVDNTNGKNNDVTGVEVIPETVGQYTGSNDKNRIKIFEGDIVTGYFNYEKIIGYIFYGGNAHFFIQRDGILGIGLDNADCWLEVIGNIYDTPQLLEKAAKDIAADAAQGGLAPRNRKF